MDKFKKAEIRERERFYGFTSNKPEIKINKISEPGDYNFYDAAIVSGGTNMLVEIKVRDFEIDKYPCGLLEKSKIDKMFEYAKKIEEKKDITVEIIYMSFYIDSVVIWDGMSMSNERNYLLPKTTMGDNSKVLTPCYEYEFEDALEIIRYEK